jgi:hypothetical protein
VSHTNCNCDHCRKIYNLWASQERKRRGLLAVALDHVTAAGKEAGRRLHKAGKVLIHGK